MRHNCLVKAIKPTTRDAIIEAAFQIYSEDPTASLADIAVRAGIGRATLHRHFSGRDELLVELAKVAIKDLDDAAECAVTGAQSYTEALRLMMHALVPLASRQWFLSQTSVENHPDILAEYQRQSEEMANDIEEAKKEGCFAADVPTTWIVQAFDNLLYAAWQMVRNEEATAKQAAALAWRTLVEGTGGHLHG